jgi:hypothetical protein
LGNFDGDDAIDAAVANATAGRISVLPSRTSMSATQLVSSQNPSVVGQPVTVTATVSRLENVPQTPTGVVTFYEGLNVLGRGTLNAQGQASFTTYTLSTGYHSLTAAYEGDPHFSASTSRVLNELVNQDTTTTTLALSTSPMTIGQTLTMSATVAGAAPGFGPPTGVVMFRDGTATIGVGTLSGGVASFSTSALPAGSHSLSALYLGDDNFRGSTSSAVSETINNPTPVLTSLGATSLVEGSGKFTLVLNGTGFLNSSSVQWNGVNLAVAAASATQLQALVPATSLTAAGVVRITVSNGGPGGGTSTALTFVITPAPVTVLGKTLSVTGAKNFSGAVATFTSANLNATATDFTAIISWDDGTATSGTISGTGTFTVSGSHVFSSFSNVHNITVTVYAKSGSSASAVDAVTDPPATPAKAHKTGRHGRHHAAAPHKKPHRSLRLVTQKPQHN